MTKVRNRLLNLLPCYFPAEAGRQASEILVWGLADCLLKHEVGLGG